MLWSFLIFFFAPVKQLRKQELTHSVNSFFFCPYYSDPFEHTLLSHYSITQMLHKFYQKKDKKTATKKKTHTKENHLAWV